MEFEKKYNLETNSFNSDGKSLSKTQTIYFGEVKSIDDPYDAGRIKVKIKGLDDKIADADLPYCHALLPKILNVMPKVGEAVRIILADISTPYKFRSWIGPIISQPQNIKKDPYYYTARATIEGGFVNPKEAPSTIPDANGIYPSKDDVALLGRDNADIILKPRELTLRAGKHLIDENLKANLTNPAYIKLKLNKDGKQSNAFIYADNVFLLSHQGDPKFKSILDDKEIELIIEKAHALPYGDILIQFINLFRDAFKAHVHPYSNMPPNDSAEVTKLKEFDVNSILSKNIKIN